MTVPASRKTENIRRSIAKFVKANFEIPNSLQGKVNYWDQTFDASQLDSWISIWPLHEGAGRKEFSLVQFDINSRVGGRLPANADRMGIKLTDLATKLHNALHVQSFMIYDFLSNRANPPPLAGAFVYVQRSDGTFREPEEQQTLAPDENGVARVILTYRFRVLADYAKADQYYD